MRPQALTVDDLNAATADRYRGFASWAAGTSPLYEEFAVGVADDPRVLSFLNTMPPDKRQPNLLFAAVKYLTGVLSDYGRFRRFLTSHEDDLRTLMLERTTQTNEPGRCAVLLPLLASLPQPLALLEAGAAAGLCLLPDRYAYDYAGHRVGLLDSQLVLPCLPVGPVPLPREMPQVVWRHGLDRNPLDPLDPDTVAWLTALVWAGEADREERLRVALSVAAADPPPIATGDIRSGLEQAVLSAPRDATLVIFHSAVMPYLPAEDRSQVVEMISSLDAVWISLEAPGVLPDIDARLPTIGDASQSFILARDGHPVAVAHQHGRSLRWL